MAGAFDYDIAVVGLGPAGATFARLAAPGRRVLAIDRPRGEGGFSKPCGGLLSSDAQKALSRFDLTLPKELLVSPQIFSVKTIDCRSGLVRHYQRFYLNLDRARFDQWLIDMLPGTVERVSGVCSDIRREGGGFAVEYSSGGRSYTARAKYVVGADGAAGIVRRRLFPERRPRSYLAVQQWFEDINPTPFYSCIFDPDISDCCSWSISKDAYFIFGGAFAPEGARAAFEAQKQKLQARFGFRFGEPLKTEACVVLRPRGPADLCTGREGAFLIGEAAGFISPSSLEGLSWAITSARLLAEALDESAAPDAAYRARTLGIRLRLYMKLLKCPFMYWPPLRRLVMQSGLNTIKVNGAQD